MSFGRLYLTVSREKRQPENDGYIAIISIGQPQFGDKECQVLCVEIVRNMKAAKAWYKRMKLTRPWETRQ